VRAGRLITLVLILQRHGRVTAAELARRLEVSERTVLRDIEALSGAGVPVYATRGAGGGFELLERRTPELAGVTQWRPGERRPGRPRRATVRISPEGRRRAALLGRLRPLRVERDVPPDEHGWLQATFRLHSLEGAAVEVLSLGPHVEVLQPDGLREHVAELVHRTALLHPGPRSTSVDRGASVAEDTIWTMPD
jgi:predicted DNA-binding transcriptional regulator YafY